MIPFPYDAAAGTVDDPAENEALNLHAQLKWVARLADEMAGDTELDLKRVMQLVMHARKFRSWYGALNARGAAAFDVAEGVFAMKKMRWANRAELEQDLADLYFRCGEIADWLDRNAPEYKEGFARSVVVGVTPKDGVPIFSDAPIKVAKSVELSTRLSEFRGRFGAKGA